MYYGHPLKSSYILHHPDGEAVFRMTLETPKQYKPGDTNLRIVAHCCICEARSSSTQRGHEHHIQYQLDEPCELKAMKIVAGTYEGFCYGWEFALEDSVGSAKGLEKVDASIKHDAQQPSPTLANSATPRPLSLVFGYNVHVGCMKSVAMTTSGTRAGQLLVTGGADERVRIYDLRDRTELGELQQHNGEIAFEPASNSSMIEQQ